LLITYVFDPIANFCIFLKRTSLLELYGCV
jgi:hypothetical protein